VRRRALVLGAGGHAAIAWETGIIAGAADRGVDLAGADVFVGTSAGAVVAAQIANGALAGDLAERYANPTDQPPESTPAVDLQRSRADFVRAREGATTPAEFLQRIATMAAAAPTISEAERRTIVERRLPVQAWPSRALRIVAVDAQTGERTVFDPASHASLVDAVAASSAVPGVWPMTTIGGRRYFDGGLYSLENADLASGCDVVVIVALRPRLPSFVVAPLAAAADALRRGGAHVEIVHPDEATEAAFGSVGGKLLDPRVRPAAVRAGRDQGQRIASQLAAVWA